MTLTSAFQRLLSLHPVTKTVACFLTIASSQLLFGQATGSISGTVRDASGSAAPGAKVIVTAPATGLTRSSATNGAGEYIVPLLGVASYTVRVELKGFQTVSYTHLDVYKRQRISRRMGSSLILAIMAHKAPPG